MPKETLDGSTNVFLPITKTAKTKKISSLPHSITFSGHTAKKRNTIPVYDGEVSLHPAQSLGVFAFENGSSKNKSGGGLVVARKDRLVQEIENSIAEIEDNYLNTARLEEEKSSVEMERNSLLRDIEETIADLQDHVLNSSELEYEKNTLKEECEGLREQVNHLKTVLDGSSDKAVNGDENDGQQLLLGHDKQISALKEEISQLTAENEHLSSRLSKDSGDTLHKFTPDEIKLLQDENANLQKLLQMTEESEDNMANELTSCHSRLTEIQKLNDDLKKQNENLESIKEQLELDREELEEELDILRKSKKEQEDKNGNVLMLKESKEELAKAHKKSVLLENESKIMKKKIDQLKVEIEQLNTQLKERDPVSVSSALQRPAETVTQLKSALEKLNKETSILHESLGKAENENASLKNELEKERDENRKLKLIASEIEKKQKVKKENESEKGKSNEEVHEVKALKLDIFNLKSECQALSETVAKTANEKRKMAKEIETLQDEKLKLESKTSEMEGIVEGLKQVKSEKEELEREHFNLKTLHGDVAKKLEIVNQDYSKKDNMLQQALAEKESIEQLCKDYKGSIERVKEDLTVSRQDTLSKQNEIKEVKKKLEEERKELVITVEESMREQQKLQDEIQVMTKRLKVTEEEKKLALQSQSSKRSEVYNLRAVVDEMRRELKVTQQKLRESEEHKLVAEEKMHMAEKVAEDLEKSNAVVNDLAMEKSLELSRTRQTLEKRVEKLLKENTELRKKCGLEAPPSPKAPLPHMAPVAVQMRKIPSLDVNVKNLSKLPAKEQRNSAFHIQAPLPAVIGSEHCSVEEVQRSATDVKLMPSRGDIAIVNNNEYQCPESTHGMDPVKLSHTKRVSNSAATEYRLFASEVPSGNAKQRNTSSVAHIGSEHSSKTSSLSSLGLEKESQWRGNEWKTGEQRLNEQSLLVHRTTDMERTSHPLTDSSVMQDTSESVFQVVGYRKAGNVINEHWTVAQLSLLATDHALTALDHCFRLKDKGYASIWCDKKS